MKVIISYTRYANKPSLEDWTRTYLDVSPSDALALLELIIGSTQYSIRSKSFEIESIPSVLTVLLNKN